MVLPILANIIAHAIMFLITSAFQETSKTLLDMPVGKPKNILPNLNMNIAVHLGLYTV